MANTDGTETNGALAVDHGEETLQRQKTSVPTDNNQASTEGTFEERKAVFLAGEKVGARKLTFAEQCGAFAALYGGARNFIVARAFGISLQATSYISGCLERDPDPYRLDTESEAVHPKENYKLGYLTGRKVLQDHNARRNPNRVLRYQEVRREFEALGKDEFNARYFTERVLDRLAIAKAEFRAEERARKKGEKIWKDPRQGH